MTKKLICMWLITMLLFLTPISAFAEEKIVGSFFIKNIKINGELIINYELQNSFFMHKNSLYMPLTPDLLNICGLTANMDWNSHTLVLTQTKPTQKNIKDRWIKNDRKDITTRTLGGAKVYVNSDVEIADNVIGGAETNMEKLNLNGLPLLANAKNIFIPVKTLVDSKSLDFDSYYDNYYGVCISTDKSKPAKSYFSQTEANYYKGLMKYIQSYNSKLSGTKALDMAYMFKRAGTLNGVDEKLLMAIAQKESKFNPSAVAAGGAVGVMQIMPNTAKTYGVSYSQLLDAKTNIEFGAMYIGNAIKRYSGNTIKGLSAYNQGGGRVDRGNYSTSYASTVIGIQNKISSFVKSGNF